jgi:hypothetical protein
VRRSCRPVRALALGTVLLAAACSVGPQAHPVVLGRPASTRAVVEQPLPTSTSVEVFFVRDGRLVPLVRRVAVGPGLTSCLAGLALPLSAKESSSGLRSALPTGVTSLQAQVNGSVATVTVPPGFDRLTVSDQILAVAQLVFTVTANTYLTRVAMAQHGHLLAMPDQSGQLVSHPLGRDDYASLAPR